MAPNPFAQFDKKVLALAALVACVLLYVDYAYIIKPRMLSIKASQQKIKQVRRDLELFTAEENRTRELEKTFSNGPVQAKHVVAESQTLELLECVSSLAQKNGLRVIQISPNRAPAAKAQAIGQTAMKLFSIDLELAGDYHNCGRFLNDVENGDVFMTVQGLKISPDGESGKQKIRITLSTYVTP